MSAVRFVLLGKDHFSEEGDPMNFSLYCKLVEPTGEHRIPMLFGCLVHAEQKGGKTTVLPTTIFASNKCNFGLRVYLADRNS